MHLSIRKFQEVYKVVTTTPNTDIGQIDRLTGVCAIIHGGTPEDYLKLTPLELSKYNVDVSVPEGKAPVKFKCGSRTYYVNHLISTLNGAGFIDLNNYTKTEKDLIENMHNIMALFTYQPSGWFQKTQTRQERADYLLEHCDRDIAYPTAVFFSSLYRNLSGATVTFAMEEQLKTLKAQRQAIQEALSDITAG